MNSNFENLKLDIEYKAKIILQNLELKNKYLSDNMDDIISKIGELNSDLDKFKEQQIINREDAQVEENKHVIKAGEEILEELNNLVKSIKFSRSEKTGKEEVSIYPCNVRTKELKNKSVMKIDDGQVPLQVLAMLTQTLETLDTFQNMRKLYFFEIARECLRKMDRLFQELHGRSISSFKELMAKKVDPDQIITPSIRRIIESRDRIWNVLKAMTSVKKHIVYTIKYIEFSLPRTIIDYCRLLHSGFIRDGDIYLRKGDKVNIVIVDNVPKILSKTALKRVGINSKNYSGILCFEISYDVPESGFTSFEFKQFLNATIGITGNFSTNPVDIVTKICGFEN